MRAGRVSIILIRSPGDAGYSVIIVPLEAQRHRCALTSSRGSADETLTLPHCPMGGGGCQCFSCLLITRLNLSLGHFIKSSLVLLKNFGEPDGKFSVITQVQQHMSQIPANYSPEYPGDSGGDDSSPGVFYPHFGD